MVMIGSMPTHTRNLLGAGMRTDLSLQHSLREKASVGKAGCRNRLARDI